MRRLGRRVAVGLVAVTTVVGLSGCTIIQHLQDTQFGKPAAVPSDVPESQRAYFEQRVNWQSCGQDLECGTVKAPLNWDAPSSESDIKLALIRLKATGESKGSLFTNPGGPGSSGVDFVRESASSMFSEEIRRSYDIVSWDPRGIGASSAVKCFDDAGMDDFIYGVPDPIPTTDAEKTRVAKESAKKFADACQHNSGPLLEYVDTMSTVRDLDMLRGIVGDEKLQYLGFSYGTEIGAHYVDTFPARVGRVVLDGATDPALDQFQVVEGQQKGFGDSARKWVADCQASTAPKCPFTGDEAAVFAQINKLRTEADARPKKAADGRKLTASVIDTAISVSMYSKETWPVLTRAFSDYVTKRDPAMLFTLSDAYFDRNTKGHYESNMFAAFPAVNCLDYPLITDPARIRAHNELLRKSAVFPSTSPDDLGDVTCEAWAFKSRAQIKPVKGSGAAPVVVVGTTGDPATPYAWAESVAKQLESATLLTYEGEGHLAYDEHDDCVTRNVDDYLLEGKVPQANTRC